ncbi:NAD(P)-binding domain-containing protein [Nostoc sp. CHAB 5784]|nr:NAD(P)-binding domain-containing protein [Nostoc mirabile CHAB5784]
MKIGIIGTGNMGRSLLNTLLQSTCLIHCISVQ